MLNGLLSQAEGLGVFALLGGALGLLVFFVSGLVFTQLSGGLTVRIAVAHAAGMFIRELLIQAHTFGGRRVAGKQTFQPVGVSTFGEFQKRSEEHTSELQSRGQLVCRLLLEKQN